MNQLIYPGDFAELHNMKRRFNGLYKLEKINIGAETLEPYFFFVNENKDRVSIPINHFENYIKSVIRTPRATKTRLC